jgi:hypothetical protein
VGGSSTQTAHRPADGQHTCQTHDIRRALISDDDRRRQAALQRDQTGHERRWRDTCVQRNADPKQIDDVAAYVVHQITHGG